MPCVITAGFEAARYHSIIANISLIMDGGNKEKAAEKLALLEKEFIGMEYGAWVRMVEVSAATPLDKTAIHHHISHTQPVLKKDKADKMNKDELITKQQLEIEELKIQLSLQKEAYADHEE